MGFDSLEEIAWKDRIDSRDLLETMKEWDGDEDFADALAILEEWQEETEDYSGDSWYYGVFFIAEDDFINYAQELAEDVGAVDSNAGWPQRCIDWEQAADELEQDYTSTTFMGRSFLYQ